jgi:hypothetical protein
VFIWWTQIAKVNQASRAPGPTASRLAITSDGPADHPGAAKENPIMNSLRYTNAMLTIIALAFSVIAVENFIRPTVAQPPTTQIQPVAICDIFGKYCLDVERSNQGSFLNVRALR